MPNHHGRKSSSSFASQSSTASSQRVHNNTSKISTQSPLELTTIIMGSDDSSFDSFRPTIDFHDNLLEDDIDESGRHCLYAKEILSTPNTEPTVDTYGSESCRTFSYLGQSIISPNSPLRIDETLSETRAGSQDYQEHSRCSFLPYRGQFKSIRRSAPAPGPPPKVLQEGEAESIFDGLLSKNFCLEYSFPYLSSKRGAAAEPKTQVCDSHNKTVSSYSSAASYHSNSNKLLTSRYSESALFVPNVDSYHDVIEDMKNEYDEEEDEDDDEDVILVREQFVREFAGEVSSQQYPSIELSLQDTSLEENLDESTEFIPKTLFPDTPREQANAPESYGTKSTQQRNHQHTRVVETQITESPDLFPYLGRTVSGAEDDLFPCISMSTASKGPLQLSSSSSQLMDVSSQKVVPPAPADAPFDEVVEKETPTTTCSSVLATRPPSADSTNDLNRPSAFSRIADSTTSPFPSNGDNTTSPLPTNVFALQDHAMGGSYCRDTIDEAYVILPGQPGARKDKHTTRRPIFGLPDDGDAQPIPPFHEQVKGLGMDASSVRSEWTLPSQYVAKNRAGQKLIEQLHEQVQYCLKRYGRESLRTGQACLQLGTAYLEHTDDTAVALRYLTKAHDIFEHKPVARAQALENMSLVVCIQGRDDPSQLSRAFVLLQETFLLRQEHLGKLHVDTVNTLNQLAKLNRQAGDLQESKRLHSQVWLARKLIFGEMHPSCAVTAHDLANVLISLKEWAEAKRFYQIALSIYEHMHLPTRNPAFAKLIKDLKHIDRTRKGMLVKNARIRSRSSRTR